MSNDLNCRRCLAPLDRHEATSASADPFYALQEAITELIPGVDDSGRDQLRAALCGFFEAAAKEGARRALAKGEFPF